MPADPHARIQIAFDRETLVTDMAPQSQVAKSRDPRLAGPGKRITKQTSYATTATTTEAARARMMRLQKRSSELGSQEIVSENESGAKLSSSALNSDPHFVS